MGPATADFERSVEFQELRAQLQNCVRRRHFYQHVSNQLPHQNPKDMWVPTKLDGATPPFDPFMLDENVPGTGPCEVGAVWLGWMLCTSPLTRGVSLVRSERVQGWTFRMCHGVYYIYETGKDGRGAPLTPACHRHV